MRYLIINGKDVERGDRDLIGTMPTLLGVVEAVPQQRFELGASRIKEVGG
jgi:hypothetical protein